MSDIPLLYVIRHGETDWNVEGRFQGSREVDLNARGIEQATANGLTLVRLLGQSANSFDYVSSPLRRTCRTMELIRDSMSLDADGYRTDDRLIEVSFGDWEGITIHDLEQAVPEKIAERNASKWDYLPPGDNAESYEILSWRVAAWLRDVDRPTICVSHGGIIRTLFHIVDGMDGNKAAEMPVPQDRILKLEGNRIGWLDADGNGI